MKKLLIGMAIIGGSACSFGAHAELSGAVRFFLGDLAAQTMAGPTRENVESAIGTGPSMGEIANRRRSIIEESRSDMAIDQLARRYPDSQHYQVKAAFKKRMRELAPLHPDMYERIEMVRTEMSASSYVLPDPEQGLAEAPLVAPKTNGDVAEPQ